MKDAIMDKLSSNFSLKKMGLIIFLCVPTCYVHMQGNQSLAEKGTSSLRSVLVWTSGGAAIGGLGGLCSAAWDSLGNSSIVYMTVLGCCAGGCLGYCIHDSRQWLAREKMFADFQIAQKTLEKTQKLLEEEKQQLHKKQDKLTEQIQKCTQNFEVKIGGLSTQLKMCAQESSMVALRLNIEQLRQFINKIDQ